MKVNDYVDIVEKTAIYPDEPSLAYVVLGLVGEAGEFIDEFFSPATTKIKITKEAGDVYWYITAICKETGLSAKHVLSSSERSIIDTVAEVEDPFKLHIQLTKTTSRLAEIAKKYYRDAETLSERDEYLDKYEDELFTLLIKTGVLVESLARIKGIDFEKILEVNYNKLIKRRKTNTLSGEGSDREEKNEKA